MKRTFDGVARVDPGPVDVTVGLENGHLTLEVGTDLIGKWRHDECRIIQGDAGIFQLEAEGEALVFQPRSPQAFTSAVANWSQDAIAAPHGDNADGDAPVPPPAPTTRVLFLGLAVATGVMGLWALLSLIL